MGSLQGLTTGSPVMTAAIKGSSDGEREAGGLTFFQIVETECQALTSVCVSLLKFLVRCSAEVGVPANAGWLALS